MDTAARVEPPQQPKSGLIWLASYPKSGNTWARMFLSNLAAIMAGETEKLELNAIARFSHSADFKSYFEEMLGLNRQQRHCNEIAAARQKVQQKIADTYEGLIFLKTHNALVIDRGHSGHQFHRHLGRRLHRSQSARRGDFAGPSRRLQHRQGD